MNRTPSTNDQSQAWKTYLLLSIISGMFVFGSLDASRTVESLQARVSGMVGHQSSLVR